ncbi:MAG TPA: zinc ribbon domain-containing protein [Paenisporosarcina sp.]|nr:zinc ribbon domain-containing protein [Paenisporosarcina sp.]
MVTYEHLCEKCNNEFEDIYGMTEPIPTKCPLCGCDGRVKRLVSGGSGRGIVNLTGHELQAKLRQEGRDLKRAALKDEKVLANLVGEDKFQKNTVKLEKAMADRPKIKTKKK